MQTPAYVIRTVIKKWFPFRGQATFCLTAHEFDQRWDGVVSELSYDDSIVLPFKVKLMERWARVPEDDHAPRRVCNPALPKKKTKKPESELEKLERLHRTAKKKDGYDCFRKPHEPLNRRNNPRGVYKVIG